MDAEDYKPRRGFSFCSVDSLITQVIILNLLDCLLTLYAVIHGVSEANPLMESLLGHGPIAFISVKVLIVTLSIVALNKLCSTSGKRLYALLSSVYWLVTFWHVFGLLHIYSMTGAS